MRARLTLKSRFTLVAAGAVAAVALAITAVAFVAIRTDLQNQVRQEVAARADSVDHLARQFHGRIPNGWVPSHSSGFGVLTYTQVITSAGVVWAPPGDAGLLTPSEAAINVAAGRAVRSMPSPRSTGPGPWSLPPRSPRAWPCRWPSR